MREMILSSNENGSKQYESSRFPQMEVVPNIEVFFLYGNYLCVTSII